MGTKLRVLSGTDIIKILASFDFIVVGQKGSHVKLQRTKYVQRETLIIPNHQSVTKKTLKSIFNQSVKYIPAKELTPHFYSK